MFYDVLNFSQRGLRLHYLIVYRCSTFFCLMLALFCLSGSQVQAAGNSEAYIGEPFGVGRVTIDVLRGEKAIPLQDERFTLMEPSGRAIYPILKSDNAGKLLRSLLKIESPRKVSIYFLFHGTEPFDLSVFTPNEQGLRIKPIQNSSAHARLIEEYWKQLTAQLQELEKDPAYPPVAENFLAAMMSRRLSKPIPKPKTGLFPWNKRKDTVLNELFLNEGFQRQVEREMIIAENPTSPANLPLPASMSWISSLESDASSEDLPVEPIARYVPEECFYLRFGNFTNYLWFRDLNKKWQGDLGNMITRRGILKGSSDRLQQQLSLKENALAKILGPQVIADAAIIGLDPYVNQGAAIGILFQAKNNFLLKQDLMKQRRSALDNFKEATESTINLAGEEVSLIATPDGQVRSYYAQKDEFHLVTTSSTLAQRFLEASDGDSSLADLPSFRLGRLKRPLGTEDALFAFVSAEFFQNLCSPQYRIETVRRLRSQREPHLLELARYAAQAERLAAQSAEELIQSGILPNGFAGRIDNSELIETEERDIDSVRGAMGCFLPVADVFVPSVNEKETSEFQQFSKRYRDEIGQMPSIAVSIHRAKEESATTERMEIDLWALDIANCKLKAMADSLGQPTTRALQPIEGDVLAAEVVLDIPVPLIGGENQPHHLFGGLRDFRSPLTIEQGAIKPDAPPAELVRGYIGAWPKPGILELLGVGSNQGTAPEPLGEQLWQAKLEEFFLISFKPDVVEQVLPQLEIQDTLNPAQIRVNLQDLTGTEMAHNVNALGYMRARETSTAASRLMNSLANLLQVPRPECREVAERQVDGEFVCPLGGEYQLYSDERGLEVWLSSALPKQNRFLLSEVPSEFEMPLLEWFRGLAGELELTDDELRVHVDIEMSKSALPW